MWSSPESIMPLSEFHRALTKGKPESAQPKISNCPSDVSAFMPDHEFLELQWENGQIVMQGQSNRPKKSSFPTAFPSHSLRFQDKDCGDGVMHKIRQFESMDSTANELSQSVPCGIGLNAQDDDMPPWMNYPVEDPLCSEFFSELSGINPNSLSADKNNGFGDKDLHNMEQRHSMKPLKEASEPTRTRASQLFQLPQQCQGLNFKSRVTDLGISGSSSTQLGHFRRQDVVAPSKSLHSSSGAGLLNFSHFSRPAALAKASTQSSERSKSNEKASSAAASTNPIESTLIESTVFQGNSALDLPKVELRSVAKLRREVVSVEQPETVHQEDASRNNHQNNCGNKIGTSSEQVNHQNSSFVVNMAAGRHETEKGPEAVVTSSVCSGNSAGAASTDPKHKAKRKSREGEESGYQSEDIEDVSVGLRKPSTGRVGTSMKRSRAAEVHNLSERRRRDRINEKMRALQELIPNCNKVDKASMLDEAIEYLKTLQLQVQMMSMGSGLCMPPMMLPPGMQHIRAPPMVHFPHMGLGMGMGVGMGYGMGMLDMSNSRGCPLIPVPSMHTPQFPCPSIPAATGLQGMQGSAGLQLFGIPGHGQGLPVSMACAPLFSPLSGLAAKGNLTHEASGTRPTSLPVSDGAPSSSKEQQQQGMNLEVIQKSNMNGTQVAKEPFEQPQLVQTSNQTLHPNSINDTGNASTRKTNYG